MKRRGGGLVELLVAMTLLGLLGTLWVRSLLMDERHTRAQYARDRSASVADELLRVLESTILQTAQADPLHILGDTAIEWSQPVGLGVACDHWADSVRVPSDPPAAWWDVAPDSADRLVVESRAGAVSIHTIVEARTRAASPRCAGGSRLFRLSPTLPPELRSASGLLVRVTRRQRQVAYRASDGLWWWGERRCGADAASACAAVQPITGPLPNARNTVSLTAIGGHIEIIARLPAAVRHVAVARPP